MTLSLYAFLALVSVTTSIISALVGMAGGTVLLAVLTVVLPWSVVIPVHGLVQLVSNFSRAFILRKHVHRRIFSYFLMGAPFGALLSVLLVQYVGVNELPFILMISLIMYTVFKPKKLPAIKLQFWQFSILGFVSAFLGLLIGATGPLLAVFFLRDDLNKEEIVATTSSIQILTHSLKIPAFLYLGFDYATYWPLIALMLIGAVVGTEIGVKVLSKMNTQMFTTVYKVALFFIAIHLLLKNVLHVTWY